MKFVVRILFYQLEIINKFQQRFKSFEMFNQKSFLRKSSFEMYQNEKTFSSSSFTSIESLDQSILFLSKEKFYKTKSFKWMKIGKDECEIIENNPSD